uniref:Transposase IS701-like DDE domain-containing protein n=1 Tax=Arsenophonus endosymbiont of Trialeurodes vaporariorum TaxID=235567 RepID=A0A3B0MGA6_9GAMM
MNYTLTNFADHTQDMSHDTINRYLRNDHVTESTLWAQVRDNMELSPDGYLLFDDTVLDKNFSHHIELVRRQYSGNAHRVIKGIGVVNCVYVNPSREQFWVINFRIYHPDGDGKSKLEHVQNMLKNVVRHKCLPFAAVLMDTWYATKEMMLFIESLHRCYYCPLKNNRLVDDSCGVNPYRHVDSLAWSKDELTQGKTIKIKGFPKMQKVKVFRVVVSTHRTDCVVTNDLSQDTTSDTHQVCDWRWKIEQFHRETKQLTGLEKCQCRNARIQRNHIACSFLVWTRLAQISRTTGKTLYRIKRGLLDDYLCQQLKKPTIIMLFA